MSTEKLKVKVTTPRYFEIGKIKEFAVEFVKYTRSTMMLSAFSTGENNGLTIEDVFEKFTNLPEWKNIYPANWHNELEDAKKEIALLVDNNNNLKGRVEQLETK